MACRRWFGASLCSRRFRAKRARAGPRWRRPEPGLHRRLRSDLLRRGMGPGGDPYVRTVPGPHSAEEQARYDARDRKWVEHCRPVIRQDRYGVARYHYAAPGCEFGVFGDSPRRANRRPARIRRDPRSCVVFVAPRRLTPRVDRSLVSAVPTRTQRDTGRSQMIRVVRWITGAPGRIGSVPRPRRRKPRPCASPSSSGFPISHSPSWKPTTCSKPRARSAVSISRPNGCSSPAGRR